MNLRITAFAYECDAEIVEIVHDEVHVLAQLHQLFPFIRVSCMNVEKEDAVEFRNAFHVSISAQLYACGIRVGCLQETGVWAGRRKIIAKVWRELLRNDYCRWMGIVADAKQRASQFKIKTIDLRML